MNSSANIPSSLMCKVIGSKDDLINYTNRLAVRTIIEDSESQIILVFVEKGRYYKLPGGGIDANEDHNVAACREALEETGCKVMLDGDCIAIAEEWRNDLHQHSYCYVAKLIQGTGSPELTELERSEGLRHEWISVSDAIGAVKASQPTSELGRYIKERDLFFVEEYARNHPSLL